MVLKSDLWPAPVEADVIAKSDIGLLPAYSCDLRVIFPLCPAHVILALENIGTLLEGLG